MRGLGTAGVAAAELPVRRAVGERPGVHPPVVGLRDGVEHGQVRVAGDPGRRVGRDDRGDLVTVQYRDAGALALVARITADQKPRHGVSIPRDLRKKSTWSKRRFSATSSCEAIWVTPESGSTLCGRPAASSAAENRRLCATTTLSSARPWMSSSGLVSLGASASRELCAYTSGAASGRPRYRSV